jgi:hypothetical protein
MRILSCLFTFSLLFSPSLFADQQYALVQCDANIANKAYYYNPITGSISTETNCGTALSKVPTNYVFVSVASNALGTSSNLVNYLFSLKS